MHRVLAFFLMSLFPTLLLAQPGLKAPPDPKPTKAVEGWGNFFDPLGDCTVRRSDTGTFLQLVVPPGIHDLSHYNRGLNAPRVLQSVSGDFRARVAVRFPLAPGNTVPPGAGTKPYHGAGLLVWAGPHKYFRFERDGWTEPSGKLNGYWPLFEVWTDNEVERPKIKKMGKLGPISQLAIRRVGNDFTLMYSENGKTWNNLGTHTVDMPADVRVGVAGLNISERPLRALFSKLEVKQEL